VGGSIVGDVLYSIATGEEEGKSRARILAFAAKRCAATPLLYPADSSQWLPLQEPRYRKAVMGTSSMLSLGATLQFIALGMPVPLGPLIPYGCE